GKVADQVPAAAGTNALRIMQDLVARIRENHELPMPQECGDFGTVHRSGFPSFWMMAVTQLITLKIEGALRQLPDDPARRSANEHMGLVMLFHNDRPHSDKAVIGNPGAWNETCGSTDIAPAADFDRAHIFEAVRRL